MDCSVAGPAEAARHGRAEAVFQDVLTGREPLEEEVGPAVAHLFVPRDPQVPLVAADGDAGLEAGGAGVAEVDVFGRVLGAYGELDLDLVAGGERGAAR